MSPDQNCLTCDGDPGYEGCVCGHGAYNHPNAGLLGKIAGQRSNCVRCECPEFRRGCPTCGRWRHVPCAQCGGVAAADEVLCPRCLAAWKPSDSLMREHAALLAASACAGDVLGPKCRICVALVAAGWGEFGEKPRRTVGEAP